MPSRLEELRAAADLMWSSINETPADKRAPLMAQWRALTADIAALSDESEAGDPVDEIAARRAARGAVAAPGSGRARR